MSAVVVLGSEEVFKVVSSWPGFRDKIIPGEIVSADVQRRIERLIPGWQAWSEISLRQVIEREIDREWRVDPETAARLGRLVTPQFLMRFEKEKDELMTLLGKLCFRGADGKHRPAKELLIIRDDASETRDDDELLRARFAPDSHVLSDDYQGTAIAFFKACRQRMEADAQTLATWVLNASDSRKQRASLDYLLRGELAHSVSGILCNEVPDSWLEGMGPETLATIGFTSFNERSVLLGQLGLARPAETSEPEILISPKQAGTTLEEVHQWWQINKAEKLQNYETQIYPGGRWPTVSSDDFHESERAQWVTLFVLGLGHSMGRTRFEQHREFLDLCRSRAWFQVFAAQNPRPEDWIGILDEYMDNYVEAQAEGLLYHQWILRIVDIYYVVRDLPTYAGAFLSINRTRKPFNLEGIVALGRNEMFQQGGLDAPPLPMRLGANFLLRELVRHRVVSSPFALEHCYVPTQRIRTFFEQLGCRLSDNGRHEDSRGIFRFLAQHLGEEKATFDLSFDLAIWFYIEEGLA